MSNIGVQVILPEIGTRSPILKGYVGTLRRAYYFTIGLLFLGILLSFGYVKWREWRSERRVSTVKKVITVTYAQLGPPPSIKGEEVVPTSGAAVRRAAPTVGIPKPVPDEKATQETVPTQEEIVGSSLVGEGKGEGVILVEDIPDINAFVPHEVEPAVTHRPPFEYPEIARMAGIEGTVFVKALIDLDGSVMKTVVVKGSGSEILDAAAVGYVSEWKLSPALQSNRPVRVWIAVPVRFVLGK